MNSIKVFLRDGGTYTITKEQIELWQSLYENIDVYSEVGYLKEMWATGTIPRKTAKNINKFINKWLSSQNKEVYDR